MSVRQICEKNDSKFCSTEHVYEIMKKSIALYNDIYNELKLIITRNTFVYVLDFESNPSDLTNTHEGSKATQWRNFVLASIVENETHDSISEEMLKNLFKISFILR